MTNVIVAARFRKRIETSANIVASTSAFRLGCPITVGKVVHCVFPVHASVIVWWELTVSGVSVLQHLTPRSFCNHNGLRKIKIITDTQQIAWG